MEKKDEQKVDFVTRKQKLMKEIAEREYRIQGKASVISFVLMEIFILIMAFRLVSSYVEGTFMFWLCFIGIVLVQLRIAAKIID